MHISASASRLRHAVVAALLASAAAPAFAQTSTETAGTSASESPAQSENSAVGSAASSAEQTTPAPGQELEEITIEVVVTGTSIRGIEAVGSKANVLDRSVLLATGSNEPVEALKKMPQVQGLGFDSAPRVAQSGLSNLQRGSAISLRGLSQNATLVLVDGRRVATTGSGSNPFTEANQLPVSFLERVDVIADGASAIYGSDAIAGVVNFITRKSFSGLELTGRFNTTDSWQQPGASVLAGHGWDELGPFKSANVVLAVDYDHRDAMLHGEKAFLRQDLRRYGGPDNRIRTNTATSGAPGNIIVPSSGNNTTLPTAGANTYYGVPAGHSGVGLTGADLLLNQPNLLDSANYWDFLPEADRLQAALNFNVEMNDTLDLYANSYYTERTHEIRDVLQSPAGLRIASTSPFYVTGVPGVAPGAPLLVSFSFAKDRPEMLRGQGGRSNYEQFGITAGARQQFGEWQMEPVITFNRSDTCNQCFGAGQGNLVVAELQRAINDGSYNPFSSTPASDEVLNRFLIPSRDIGRAAVDQYSLRFDGPLFGLPAGDVRMAFGGERFHYSTSRFTRGSQNVADTDAFASRNVTAAYAELFAPILAEGVVPFVHRLDLDVAGRFEDYSDFGSTTNPKIGLIWEVTRGLSLRGSWGTSFRAPPLAQTEPGFFSSVVVVPNLANNTTDIPLTNSASRTSNVLRVSGSNPNLTPEEAETLSLGIDFTPDWLPGLHASGTYYRVEYSDQIVGLQTISNTFLASQTNRETYASFITPAPQPSTCVAGVRSTYNPLIAAAMSSPSVLPVDEANACSVVAVFNVLQTNASTTAQDGLDLEVGYDFDTGLGRFMLGLNGAYILDNELQLTAQTRKESGVDRINFPISLRGRANAGWLRDRFSANLAMNYIGSYTNDLPITLSGVTRPVQRVPSWTTFDLHLAYETPKDTGWLGGLRASATFQNLFDKDPPIVLSTNGYAVDVQTHSVFGRIVSLQLRKEF